MPKPTFLNLDPEKRARIFDVALDEFAARPFDQASVSAIVRRLGIAKGSIYQYFDDKVDLFGWLLDQAAARRVQGVASPEGADLFEGLRLAYRAGLEDHAADPRPARLGLRLLEPSVEPRLHDLRQRYVDQVHAWWVARIRAAIAEGSVRAEVDPELAAHLARGLLSEGLLAAFRHRMGENVASTSLQEGLTAADEAVDWLRRAIGRSVAEPTSAEKNPVTPPSPGHSGWTGRGPAEDA